MNFCDGNDPAKCKNMFRLLVPRTLSQPSRVLIHDQLNSRLADAVTFAPRDATCSEALEPASKMTIPTTRIQFNQVADAFIYTPNFSACSVAIQYPIAENYYTYETSLNDLSPEQYDLMMECVGTSADCSTDETSDSNAENCSRNDYPDEESEEGRGTPTFTSVFLCGDVDGFQDSWDRDASPDSMAYHYA